MNDKIFLLSLGDVTETQYGFQKTWQVYDAARQRANTLYVSSKADMWPENHFDNWWLRSSGLEPVSALFVGEKGYSLECTVTSASCAVCPALYLDLLVQKKVYAGTVCDNGNVDEVPFVEKDSMTVLQNPRNTDEGVLYDCIWFGQYAQSDATGAVVEPIKWRVLKIENGVALLHSEKNLDVRPFHEERETVTWEQSTIRSWLNGYSQFENALSKDYTKDNFVNHAFTQDEQRAIITPHSAAAHMPSLGREDQTILEALKDTSSVLQGDDSSESQEGRLRTCWGTRGPLEELTRSIIQEVNTRKAEECLKAGMPLKDVLCVFGDSEEFCNEVVSKVIREFSDQSVSKLLQEDVIEKERC